MSNKRPKLILIDGYSFVFRAYHALSRTSMNRKDGTPVGAVFAFTNMLIKTINSHDFDYIAVVFDAGQKTFRNKIYPEYKANRPPAPDDLVLQFPIVREVANAMNIQTVEKVGVEADDIIATYATQAKQQNIDVVIFSSDKDLMQLINDNVKMYDSVKFKDIVQADVVKKFGVEPEKLLDVLSLMGDSADNVPGVPSIGPKIAAELINKYGSIENLYDNLDEITQKKRRETLAENKDKAILSRELIDLKYDVEVDYSIEDLTAKKIEPQVFAEFLKEQGFKSLLAKYSYVSQEDVSKKTSNNQQIDIYKAESLDGIRNWFASLGEIRNIAIHSETDSKKQQDLAVSFVSDNKCCYVDLSTDLSTDLLAENLAPKQMQASLFDSEVETMSIAENANTSQENPLQELIIFIKDILEDKSINKIFYNLKPICKICINNNIDIANYDDIMMMSYSVNCGRYEQSLENIIDDNIDDSNINCFDVDFIKSTDEEKPIISSQKASLMLQVYNDLRYKLHQSKSTTLYERLEKPLIKVIAQMEVNGITVDKNILQNLSTEFKKKSAEIEAQIHQLAGEEFNIGSPKQLGEILFGKLELPKGKKSKKTGAYSTDVKVLQALADDGYEIVKKVLVWRHFTKITSTYTEALQKKIKQDGRIRTTYEMAVTNTGRLSSKEPNLQNIPIRTEEGNKIRSAFVAKEGHDLMSADYSQIELRLLAQIADIDVLKHAFRNNIDIHRVTASQMFGVKTNYVTSEQRRQAKTINFGIIYGISAFGLAQRLGIERGRASEYIKQYFIEYPGIKEYMDKTIGFARENGYVETIMGRRCFINGIKDSNAMVRQFSERAAINAPLQGSASDIIKKAMININKELVQQNSKAKILLQVHDELIVESPKSETENVMNIVKTQMQNAVTLAIPLDVECESGKSWLEIH